MPSRSAIILLSSATPASRQACAEDETGARIVFERPATIGSQAASPVHWSCA
ncbi:hypothetical protein Agau_P200530 (plasmid) [Agrobacterium tumefaciens F2]|nr:hypothetical protein Agau_P200530 [Agrobacterium tumefaciens F2]